MIQNRRYDELFDTEVAFGTVNPGAILTNGIYEAAVALTLNGGKPASAALGDVIDCVPPAGAGALTGLIYKANPSATVGTVTIGIHNASAGTVTPTSAVWKFIIRRFKANVT